MHFPQYCEYCKHSVMDQEKYHGTMIQCRANLPYYWDKTIMDYFPKIKPCPQYKEQTD